MKVFLARQGFGAFALSAMMSAIMLAAISLGGITALSSQSFAQTQASASDDANAVAKLSNDVLDELVGPIALWVVVVVWVVVVWAQPGFSARKIARIAKSRDETFLKTCINLSPFVPVQDRVFESLSPSLGINGNSAQATCR